jgi:cobalt transporter subunit CbtA
VPLEAALPHNISFRRLALSALVGAIVAGALFTLLQQVFLIPLLLQAEALEAPGHGLPSAVGPERAAVTVLFNFLTGFGYGLLLAAAYALHGKAGWRRGLLWGLAGFATFALAPALGLPPDLPGGAVAPLGPRQLWWLGTAAATAVGLAGIVFARPMPLRFAGLGLILLPHLIGAPQPLEAGTVSAAMAETFAVRAVLIALPFWLALGAASGAVYRRVMSS